MSKSESDKPTELDELTSLSDTLAKQRADIDAAADVAKQEAAALLQAHANDLTQVGDEQIKSLLGLTGTHLQDALDILSRSWMDFHLELAWPEIPPQIPGVVIEPEHDPVTGKTENVYTIVDYGNRLSTSRGEEVVNGITTTGKFFNTIEKMVRLAIDKVFGGAEGSEEEMAYREIHFNFQGHELAKRKAFETLACRDENIYVLNYDPDRWGEVRLKMIESMSKQGYGIPRPKF
ncbi:MAG: hypothetical protein GKR77_01430 [Legionellales bacterium]|nr:hypothetical protein [Legionellales bacterium]